MLILALSGLASRHSSGNAEETPVYTAAAEKPTDSPPPLPRALTAPEPATVQNAKTAPTSPPSPESTIDEPRQIRIELDALELVLASECYDEQEQDKRNVLWVIFTRVDSDKFRESDVISAITAPGQFSINPSREISESDRAIAAEVYSDWRNGDYSTREAPYLFFSAGDRSDHVNEFRINA
jgi:hypothetical protein